MRWCHLTLSFFNTILLLKAANLNHSTVHHNQYRIIKSNLLAYIRYTKSNKTSPCSRSTLYFSSFLLFCKYCTNAYKIVLSIPAIICYWPERDGRHSHLLKQLARVLSFLPLITTHIAVGWLAASRYKCRKMSVGTSRGTTLHTKWGSISEPFFRLLFIYISFTAWPRTRTLFYHLLQSLSDRSVTWIAKVIA